MTDKEEKRESIVQRARELFARFGFRKTTMNEIAAECSMSKATLYYYFKGKEDIFRAVIDFELNIFKRRMGEALSSAKTPHDKLRVFFKNRVIYLKELVSFYSIIVGEYLEHYTFIEHQRLKFNDWEIQTLQSILDEGVEKGIFNISDSKTTAAAFFFALKGLEYLIVGQHMINTDYVTDVVLPLLFEGIDKR